MPSPNSSTGRCDEEHRHRCEVRYCLEKRRRLGPERGRDWFESYFQLVRKKRGNDAAMRLYLDAKKQWKHGNRGTGNAWVEVRDEVQAG